MTQKRLRITGGASIGKPIRNYDNFNLDDNGNLTFTYKNKVINFFNINDGLIPSSKIRELGTNRLKLMGFKNITDEDIHPYRNKYNDTREKVRNLSGNLNETSKSITSSSSSTTVAQAIKLMKITSEDIDTTVKDVEHGTPFIEACERDKLLPLRESEGFDKQLRTIR